MQFQVHWLCLSLHLHQVRTISSEQILMLFPHFLVLIFVSNSSKILTAGADCFNRGGSGHVLDLLLHQRADPAGGAVRLSHGLIHCRGWWSSRSFPRIFFHDCLGSDTVCFGIREKGVRLFF